MANARQELAYEDRILAVKVDPGADDEEFLHSRRVLEALLSLKHDRGLCRDLTTAFQVLSALMAGGQTATDEFSPLYLAAVRAFEVPMNRDQEALVKQ